MFPKTYIGFYWHIIKGFPWYFGAVVFFGAFSIAINRIFEPIFSKLLVSIFETAQTLNTQKIIILLSFLFALRLIPFVLSVCKDLLGSRVGPRVKRQTEVILLNRIYKNDYNFFVNKMSGEILSKCVLIQKGMDDLILNPLIRLLGMLVAFGALVGMMVGINFWFVIIVMASVAFRIVWQYRWRKKINNIDKELVGITGNIGGVRTDGLTNALTVQLFANEKRETDYLYVQTIPEINMVRHRGNLALIRWMPSNLFNYVAYFITIVLVVYYISENRMSLSDGMFVVMAFNSIYSMFVGLTNLFTDFANMRVKIEQAWKDVIVEPQIVDKPNARNLKIRAGSVSFDDVTFAYTDKKILKHFCLDIRPNEKIGVVGLSGAGKTTLTNLVLRTYDVQGGAIKIDGQDIRDIKKESLRKNISLVPQDISLFNRTIFENIAYARPGAKKSAVIDAAKKAQIHEFIMGLSNGYDTIVGNRGIKLSGGQRQRIAIARAILKDAPILILDEATSALDSVSEHAIQKALTTVMKNKTVLVIAHRLFTLRAMDRIVVMDHGNIVQIGTHKQLLRQDGIYKKLWNIQKQ